MALEVSSNAGAKLEPFLLMSKSAKGAAAAKLIQDATSAPGVFVFSELLEMPNIQELRRTRTAVQLWTCTVSVAAPALCLRNMRGLLQCVKVVLLSARRTSTNGLSLPDSSDSLPSLSQAQLTKLRLLTILSLALDRRILPYDLLLRMLRIPTIRELEDLIIDGIYLDLMRGKLDQKEQQFEVEYITGRDLGPGKVESLLLALREWANTTSSTLATLDAQIARLASQTEAERRESEAQERAVQTVLAEVYEKQRENKGRGKFGSTFSVGGDRDDSIAMDIDEPHGYMLPGSLESAKMKKPKSSATEYSKPITRKRNRF
ncbi:hypothetical protein EW145_g1217 [Phellinidium pouzarii]|uniref:PCI domain-containing protein n=1 Tax=Phellinidium pouzarii TaxID=167371 RepID=A0A4S4LH38_9AGAM|nr:hypothetical protein EW145_g1217 [Phellinidium pouzarii]